MIQQSAHVAEGSLRANSGGLGHGHGGWAKFASHRFDESDLGWVDDLGLRLTGEEGRDAEVR
jgi:hypothetical protein